MNEVKAEIVSTGTEILQGLYADRNAGALAARLDAAGFRVTYLHAVRDEEADLESLLAQAANRAHVLVMTGGLGPTEDDVNRDVIARVWQAPVQLDPVAETMMRERFESRGIAMPERNVVQAMIPRGAQTFYNHNGTAPGFGIPASVGAEGTPRAALIALPGPPPEWQPMWEADAEPWLLSQFPNRCSRCVLTWHLSLIPESVVNQALRDLFHADPRVEVTLLASRGHVRLRVIASGENAADSRALAERVGAEALSRLPKDVLLTGREPAWSLEQELSLLLRDGRRTIATAESCTGGLVAERITSVPGASEYFRAGYVVYANETKTAELGVKEATLDQFGAVSRECVLELAAGARRRARAEAAVAVSGIAGPSGGSDDKPVGTVWLALDSADRGAVAVRRLYKGNREAVREWASRAALDLLRRWAAGLPWPPETG